MTSSRDQVRETFGAYAIDSVLGRGGYSTVYRAELLGSYGFRKPVALKVMRNRLSYSDEPASRDFLNEARLGAAVRHANLVEFYECGRVGDRLYIALELVEGPTLADIIKVAPTLGLELEDNSVLSVVMQSALGLRALHAAKVDGVSIRAIHRDFKPGNILISVAGEVKLTDYGISRYANDGYQTLGADSPLGSPLYMSPEQARGEELTQSSDIFAFGTSMLELITGRPVFGATTIEGIVHQVGRADVSDALSDARERFPQLVHILENCLLPDPQSRYADGAALVEGLKDATPPAFAEEALGALAHEVFEAVEFKRKAGRKRPVKKFWNSLSDDEDSVSIEIRPGFLDPSTEGAVEQLANRPQLPAETLAGPAPSGQVEAPPGGEPPFAAAETLVESGQETRSAPLESSSDTPSVTPAGAEGRRRYGLWIAVAFAALVLLAAVVWPWTPRAPDGDSEGPPEDGGGAAEIPTAGAPTDDEVAPPAEESTSAPEVAPPALASDESPTPTEVQESIEAPTPAPPQEVTEPPTEAPAPQKVALTHTPIQRGIRGRTLTLPVAVTPAGRYQFTLWYRAAPDGTWNRLNDEGGERGDVSLTLPAGPWIATDQQTVEYFIEVDTASGPVRTGSATSPHTITLY